MYNLLTAWKAYTEILVESNIIRSNLSFVGGCKCRINDSCEG